MRRILMVFLAFFALLLSCSEKLEGPKPSVEDSALTYCGADRQGFVVRGAGLSPMVENGATDDPELAMPRVCLTRTADANGQPVSGEPTQCLKDEDVQWISQKEIRFSISDTLGLAPGTYDVTITNPDGSKASGNVTLLVRSDGPLILWADPSVVFNGISTQITLFGSNLGIVDQVVLRLADDPDAPEIDLQFTLAGTLENRIQAIVPKDTPVGTYDVIARKVGGCETILYDGLKIVDLVDLSLTSIDPSFGWADVETPVTIAGQGFAAVPRAYLNPVQPAADTVASGLTSVAFVSGDSITAVVPPGLPVGGYDLIVVNPDGRVGLLPAAFQVTANAPPVIDSVSPNYVGNNEPKTVTVQGSNFDNPTVTARCRAPDGTETTINGTVAAGGTATQFDVTLPVQNLVQGTVCVVRVTNADGSYADYSAVGISNPSLNLNAFSAGSDMNTARRAPAVTSARATTAARFVYAIGGDDGSPAGALASVEAVPIDIFGVPGQWFTQQVSLPAPRTLAGVARIGRFLYLVGGNDGSGPVPTVTRAQVLDPLAAPNIVDVAARKGADESEGLGAGVWYYRVAAVMADSDPSNPGGETLPSDPLVVNLSAKASGTLVLTLIWEPVAGAKAYRVYRNSTGDLPVGSEQLVTEIADGAATSYEDVAPPGAVSGKPPLPLGSTGVWVNMPDLATAREAHGVGVAQDPADAATWHVYAVAGRAGAVLASSERMTVTLAAGGVQTAAAWAAEAPISAARSGLSVFSVSHAEADQIPSGTTYLYAGGGTGSNSLDASQVAAGGALSWTANTNVMSPNQSGYAGAAGAGWLFAFGGQQGKPGDKVDAGRIDPADLNQLLNWQPQGGSTLATPRHMAGSAVESAFLFVVGGATGNGSTATATMERTVL